jgi:phosphohistidine phosphatase
VRIYVVRHGPAEDNAPSGKDFDRALTTSGRERVREVARALRRHDEQPRVILSSPLVRALQTAEVIAAELGVTSVETSRDMAPGGDAVGLVRGLVAQQRKRTMVVGHQPDLTLLIEALIGERFPFDMLKAMVVGLDAHESNRVSTRFVLDPKSLDMHRGRP